MKKILENLLKSVELKEHSEGAILVYLSNALKVYSLSDNILKDTTLDWQLVVGLELIHPDMHRVWKNGYESIIEVSDKVLTGVEKSTTQHAISSHLEDLSKQLGEKINFHHYIDFDEQGQAYYKAHRVAPYYELSKDEQNVSEK